MAKPIIRKAYENANDAPRPSAHPSTVIVYYSSVMGVGPKVQGNNETPATVNKGSGSIATQSSVAAGAEGVAVGGNVEGPVIVAGNGSTIVIGDAPIAMTAVQRDSKLGQYLSHVISRNRYLQLQGIRSGGRLVNIELEHIYITLKATRTRSFAADGAWLEQEQHLAPGERHKLDARMGSETVTVKVEEALAEHRHLVVLGDPGSGKTTFMRYLALCYARDRAEGGNIINRRLGLDESGYLPILLPLRNLGAYLQSHYPRDDGVEGHARLLEFLRVYLHGERIEVPDDFFDTELAEGRVLMLLDGMDEVGDFDLRRRLARLVERFASAYSRCRVVVTSRLVGYTGAARLGESFATTTVQDFSLSDVQQFLTHWHRLVAIGQMGPGDAGEHFAVQQTQSLLEAIRTNPRVRELAINPLMLTVIALVHRDRVKLPERRAELYAEAVDVLLGKWEEAKGLGEAAILENSVFDNIDRRLLLQSIALMMHESGTKELPTADLMLILTGAFFSRTGDERAAQRSASRFLEVIQERTGLLVEAGLGVHRFSHLTFQEYLAAVEAAEREDYLDYTLQHSLDPFWREVILLEAGYLSTKHQAKTTRLIRRIAETEAEPELFHNLTLAAECVRDVGPQRVEAGLMDYLVQRLRKELDRPLRGKIQVRLAWLTKITGGEAKRKQVIRRRLAAAKALSRIASGNFGGSSPFWHPPFGEPVWVTIPAGEFWMGEGKESHPIAVPAFKIAMTPITNAQYQLYVQATGANPPSHWQDGQPPKDTLEHPVTLVSWDNACAYCDWLGNILGKTVSLPTEAEWEKAARGDRDQRSYPWGDEFDPGNANTAELGLGETTPVGLFPSGASPAGCLDMAGNVWEWTHSLWRDLPYQPDDGREDPASRNDHVLRGGAFDFNSWDARCSARLSFNPDTRDGSIGFRVVVSPFTFSDR